MSCNHTHSKSPACVTHSIWNSDLLSAVACGALLVAALIAPRCGASASSVLAILLASCVAGGWHVTIRSLEQLGRFHFDVDLLMLVAAIGAGFIGRFEESAILLLLFSLGHGLEGLATNRARNAIRTLGTLTPKVARVVRDGRELEVPVEDLAVGDLVRVMAGERIAVDGEIREGVSAVDQSPITGESVPVVKEIGADVFAGTVNGDGLLLVATTKLASQTTMARMVTLVEESHANKGRTQRLTERFTRIYTPIVLVSVPAIIVVLVSFFDMSFSDAFLRAMAVLVGASPCALVISTPSAVLAGVAQAARSGVLIKGGMHLESLGIVRAIAFDKTGTVTLGRPDVTDVVAAEGFNERDVIAIALALDQFSSHPLAQAVVRKARRDGVVAREIAEVRALPGRGVEGMIDGKLALVAGPRSFVGSGGVVIPPVMRSHIEHLQNQARTVSVITHGEHLVGVIAMADQVRPHIAALFVRLKSLGIRHLVMLTGDNAAVATAVAAPLGIDEVKAGLLPEQKIEAVHELMKRWGVVAMVGDGVNDAPALASATVGIAMGATGTDVALEAADIALMADDLSKLPFAVGLSRRARRTITQNVALSLGVVGVLIPCALFGFVELNWAVVLHEGSTVVVAFNALRLLLYKESA
ncbi:MAG: heavy metal translocating P-type ATPase [Phycisphaerales bacterium]|nr:heavy metal translocating P-type ATPase [Phycisphaerales bacterium]